MSQLRGTIATFCLAGALMGWTIILTVLLLVIDGKPVIVQTPMILLYAGIGAFVGTSGLFYLFGQSNVDIPPESGIVDINQQGKDMKTIIVTLVMDVDDDTVAVRDEIEDLLIDSIPQCVAEITTVATAGDGHE